MALTKEMNDKGQLELKSGGTTLLTVVNPTPDMMEDEGDFIPVPAPQDPRNTPDRLITDEESDPDALKDVEKATAPKATEPKAKAPRRKKAQKKEGQPYTNPVYQYVTDRIIKQLEEGTVPWQKGYKMTWPVNARTGKGYRGINIWLLLDAMDFHGYEKNHWLTYKQARDLGGSVKKGEKSPQIVVFYKLIDKRTPAEKAEYERIKAWTERKRELSKKVYRVLRYTNVFNIEQTEGIDPEKLEGLEDANRMEHAPVDNAEELLTQWKNPPTVKHGGNQAYYNPSRDKISMPGIDRYEIPERYYKTRFHESVHATGHESRLERPGVTDANKTDMAQYSYEELIAELGASMLCTLTGIYTEENHENASAYIAHWLEQLSENPMIIVQASNEAQKAVDNIQNITWD